MANKARNQTKGPRHASWFQKNVERRRKANKAARKSRRANRG